MEILRQNKKILIILGVIFIVVGFICLCCSLSLVANYYSTQTQERNDLVLNPSPTIIKGEIIPTNTANDSNPSIVPQITYPPSIGGNADRFKSTVQGFIPRQRIKSNPEVYNFIEIQPSTVPSVYLEEVPISEPPYVATLEYLLLRNGLIALRDIGWNGDSEVPNLKLADYGLTISQANEMLAYEEAILAKRDIPSDLEQVFESAQGKRLIETTIDNAIDEFLFYLKIRGVDQNYIDEINNHTLVDRDSRVRYFPLDDQNKKGTSTRPYQGGSSVDASTLEMDITAAYIYVETSVIMNSQVLGSIPSDQNTYLDYYQDAMEMATRYIVYHEMAHVLQIAYMNVHTDSQDLGLPSNHIRAKQSLMDLDTDSSWLWSRYNYIGINGRNNNDSVRSRERQAEGMTFEILTNVYRMSPAQRDSLWSACYGRLEGSYQVLLEVKDLLESNWPEMYNKNTFPKELSNKSFDDISDVQDRLDLRDLLSRASNMQAHAGYMDPMTPDEIDSLWQKLAQ